MLKFARRAAVSRRVFLGATSALAVAAMAPAALAQGEAIKIGYVTPQTGPLAAFAEADDYVIQQVYGALGGTIETADGPVSLEIIVRDSQSNPNRAAEVARQLIVDDGVQLIVVASTPETTNPVSAQCEIEGIPCISTVAPWQPWFIERQANPADPATWESFDYTYHFFWGLEDVIATYQGMWNQLDTNMQVGGLFPNDADGNAWGNPDVGLPPALAAGGYTVNDPGRYQNLSDDFTAQIDAFKAANADIVTGVVIPPDFTTFWTQANQQGYRPKVASIAKAILFPIAVEALGEAGHNLSTEVWWSASHPFTSSLSGASAGDLASGFTEATGRPWTQPIGFVHALFEVATDSIKRAEDPFDPDSLADAIAATNLDTIVGHIEFGAEGLPPAVAANVSKTPLVGGQWRLQDDGSYDLVIVENAAHPEIPTGGTMEAIE
ncbi:ABC transporter substrate-binding protein [Devosia sp. XK-2]|uniref:ABC transporter substrate-binding protein n=2 Tax=Devosia sp. XK-2 TaxID=3126689 RepID=UPI0030CD6B7F